jgi:hypothetical protein
METKLRTQLAVQKALQQGRDSLQRGNYQAAVYVLEGQIARISGSREYLTALCEAYRGYLRELRQNNRPDEVEVYLARLQILDPGARLDNIPVRPAPPPPAPVAAAPSSTAPPIAALAGATPPPGGRAPVPAAEKLAPAAPLARGVPPEGEDPFAESNVRQTESPRALVARAGQEFASKHYAAAARLYDQAHQADPNSTAGSRDQWAYCKLNAVFEAMKRDGPVPADLEAEVRRALAMTTAPKLEEFGKDLLRRVQERRTEARTPADSATAEVKHTPAQGAGWAIAETANFRIFHRQSPDFAEKVAHIAESARVAMSRKWFGDMPPAWTPRCDVYLHATAKEYSQATPAPSWSPGHSTMHAEGDRVVVRRMDLRCDAPHLLEGVVPHETTHIVLCGRFGKYTVPRWVDEGVAVLTEPRELVELHLRNLPRHRQDQTLFPLAQLLKFYDKYPDARSIGPFYAQSVSLVEYLSSLPGGPRVFIQFVRDGLEGGYEAALAKHYGIQGFADLEQLWQQHAFGTATAARMSYKTR